MTEPTAADSWMRKPWLLALAAGLAVLMAAFIPALWRMGSGTVVPQPHVAGQAPWNVSLGAPGVVAAWGLTLPGATLADARKRWPGEFTIALVGPRDGPVALEAYVERWEGGGVTGKLVLAADAPPAMLERWRARARSEVLPTGGVRWALTAEDAPEALRQPVSGMTLLPASRLDAATLRERFGEPGEVHAAGSVQHLLFAPLGLAIAWSPDTGRSVLQRVAPADFARRLRAPLIAPQGQGASAAASAGVVPPTR